MELSQDFVAAFNHVMLYEVGPFWNSADPDVIAGAIQTPVQRRKVGFVNIPSDHGGVTKYGIAQNDNPSVNVTTLNLAGAMQVYASSYWTLGHCDQIPKGVSLIHFDGCVNNGVGRAARFLQGAVGATQDGMIGPMTLQSIQAADPATTISNIAQARVSFYNAIVANNPSQGMFLAGWLRRVNEVKAAALAALQ